MHFQDPTDDSNWLEACDELIQQFASGSQKKRGRKSKAADVDEPETTPGSKQIKLEKSDSADEANAAVDPATTAAGPDQPAAADDIKKEEGGVADDAESGGRLVKTPPKEARVKAEKEDAPTLKVAAELKADERRLRDSERDHRVEERRTRDADRERRTEKQSPETRGQRSNSGTARLRIQNLLEPDSSDTEIDTDEDDRDDDDDFEETAPKKPVAPAKTTKSPKKPIAQAQAAKKKKLPPPKKQKNKKNKNKMVSKKLKKVDVKREKMRHMILRRIETRKSKLEAMKNLRKAKTESTSSDDSQPIMTRKMARRECQKDRTRDEVIKKKPTTPVVKSGKGKATGDKDEKKGKEKVDKVERIEKTEKAKTEAERPERPETRNQVKCEKLKKSAEKAAKKSDRESKNEKEKPDDVTRRTLRSRNVVVVNDKHPKNLKKKVHSSGGGSGGANQKPKSPTKVKRESKNEEREAKEKVKIKEEDKPKVKEKEPEKERGKTNKGKEVEPSWEEELFNYKYSLRMPVKLINIARPTNWPKSSGGASSLPDLDRKETDSDLLNGISKPKTPNKKNKDESKYSNSKEFKESVKHLKEKFDKKIEEKNQATDLHKLMMEKKMKIIPKSSDGPELLPTPILDSFRSKLNSLAPKKEGKRGKINNKTDDDSEKDEVIGDSLIG